MSISQTNEETLRNFNHGIYTIRRCLETITHFNERHFNLSDFSEDYAKEISENYKMIHKTLNEMYIKNLKGLCVIARQNVQMALMNDGKYKDLCMSIVEERMKIEKMLKGLD